MWIKEGFQSSLGVKRGQKNVPNSQIFALEHISLRKESTQHSFLICDKYLFKRKLNWLSEHFFSDLNKSFLMLKTDLIWIFCLPCICFASLVFCLNTAYMILVFFFHKQNCWLIFSPPKIYNISVKMYFLAMLVAPHLIPVSK